MGKNRSTRNLLKKCFPKDESSARYPPIFLRVPFAPSKLWIPFASSLHYPQEKPCQLYFQLVRLYQNFGNTHMLRTRMYRSCNGLRLRL